MEKVQDSSLLPVNVERKITLVGQHLNLFQVMFHHPAEKYYVKPVFVQSIHLKLELRNCSLLAVKI